MSEVANDTLNKTVHSVKELFLEVDLCHRTFNIYPESWYFISSICFQLSPNPQVFFFIAETIYNLRKQKI